jgi:hypothetical protein
MMAQETDEMFNFRYEKTAQEIKEAAHKKIEALESKIKDREGRVAKLRKENSITDLDMAELYEARHRQAFQGAMYSFSNSTRSRGGEAMEERTIAVNVVNGIFSEKDAIAADTATVKKLNLITRNLRPMDRITDNGTTYKENAFQLSEQELEFLGF